MKIALLYIGIGKYASLWDDFYRTCQLNFIPGEEKHYFFVTDRTGMSVPENVTLIFQEDLGWPCNTMFRFMFFLRVKEALRQYDYLFFCNANTRFVKPVKKADILPSKEDGNLLMLTWQPLDGDPDTFPFERRKESAAYVPFGTKQLYYQGTLNGGAAEEYIDLFERCHKAAMQDFECGYIPTAHDESILNSCMMGYKCKIVESEYGRPEHRDKSHTAKIVFADKDKIFGRAYLRSFKRRPHSNTLIRRVLRKLHVVD